ncbi:MAG: gliding motility-associated C-terminal domain-containing protein [Chitinophagaceae bacterium]|nr:gliding motility-associated C-terminal domain-containing protein [Chitinophagaceae bacterium]
MVNRRLFVAGPNISGAPIMEYGNPSNINVNSTEAIVASCTVGAKGSVVVNTTGGIAPYTYSLNGGTFQSSNTFSNLAAGNYTITIKDAFCGTLTKTVTVGLKQTPVANAGPDYTIVIGDEVTLQGSGATGASVLWSPSATLTNANTFTPVAKPSVTTPYVMTVTSTDGCIGTDNNVVTVIPFCLDIKNAFSPNGDGINDKWVVTNGFACTNQIYAAVYNRYGSLVYKNDNYTNNWDGTYNGKPVPDGTYYYVVTYKLINGKSIILKGDVTILR